MEFLYLKIVLGCSIEEGDFEYFGFEEFAHGDEVSVSGDDG